MVGPSSDIMSTEDREKLKLQLMRHEGIRLKVYADTVGVPTIGVGRNLRAKGISYDEAQFLLENDLDDCIHDCIRFPWFIELDAVRQRAVVDLRFNLGSKGLRTFKKFLACMAIQAYARAARQLEQSKWFGQVKTRGPRIVQMIEFAKDPL